MLDTNTPTSPVETPEIETPQAPQPSAPAPSPEHAPQPKPEETVDYWKERYGKSTTEAQLILEQNRLLKEQNESLTKPHDPTDAELRAAYPEWDSMMPDTQRLARENFSLKKGHASIQQTTAEIQAEIHWGKDLKGLLKKPEFAGLKNREDEFEEYVFKPNHRGIPTETLARSFLFGTVASANPAPAPAPAPVATAERSSGGPAPSSKKLSAAEAKTLRETNYEEYKRQLDADNIDFDV